MSPWSYITWSYTPAFPVWVVLVVLLAWLLYIYATAPFTVWKKLGIPGPKPTWLSHTPELYKPERGMRTAIRSWIKQHGKVFGIYYFRTPALVVSDPELLKQVFVAGHQDFPDRWFFGEGKLLQDALGKVLFFESGKNWKRLRSLITPAFSGRKLKLMMHHITRTGRNLGDVMLSHAEDGTPVPTRPVCGAYTLDVIGGVAFGLDINCQKDSEEPLLLHTKKMMTFGKRVNLMVFASGYFPFILNIINKLGMGYFDGTSVRYFTKRITELVAEKRSSSQSNSHDFLQMLINIQDENKDGCPDGSKTLSLDEIVAQGILFFIAGYGTTSSLLQFLLYEIGRHPHIQEKIFSEIEQHVKDRTAPTYEECHNLAYLDAVMKETLRRYPPLHLLTRTVARDVTLGQYPAPAGSALFIPIGNIMEDPDNFVQPERFLPERFRGENNTPDSLLASLPFGFGPRNCIGSRLAMLMVKVAVVAVLSRVEVVAVAPTHVEMEDFLAVLEPKQPISLTVRRRE